jgi:hypothetical protein
LKDVQPLVFDMIKKIKMTSQNEQNDFDNEAEGFSAIVAEASIRCGYDSTDFSMKKSYKQYLFENYLCKYDQDNSPFTVPVLADVSQIQYLLIKLLVDNKNARNKVNIRNLHEKA